MKEKIIIALIAIVFVMGCGFVYTFIFTEKENESYPLAYKKEKNTLKESPYTLDELYTYVQKGMLSDDEVANVLCNFYDYFNKNTDFMIVTAWDISNDKLNIYETDYISYEQYMDYWDNYSTYGYEKGTRPDLDVFQLVMR